MKIADGRRANVHHLIEANGPQMNKMTSSGKLSLEAAKSALLSTDPQCQAEGVSIIEKLNGSGDAIAAYAIGTWHLFGAHGYELSEKKAAPYLQYAAERDVPEALFDLAVMLERQKPNRRANKDAFANYLLAALLGDKSSLAELSRCFYWGIGTFKNEDLSEHLFRIAEGKETQRAVSA
ncbi:MAG: tetratricopeptide repeat protein [Caulobacteraceae bacterium]